MVEQLGAHLVRKGLLSQAQLDEALKSQLIYGGSLGTHLVELRMLDMATLGQALSDTFHFPQVTETELASVPAETLALLRPELARHHLAFPLALEGRRLRMALVEPQDPRHVDALAFATGMRIVPAILPEPRLLQLLERHYGIPRPLRPQRPGPAQAPVGQGATPSVRPPPGAPPPSLAAAPGPCAARPAPATLSAPPPRPPPAPGIALRPSPAVGVLDRPPPAAVATASAPIAWVMGACAVPPPPPPRLSVVASPASGPGGMAPAGSRQPPGMMPRGGAGAPPPRAPGAPPVTGAAPIPGPVPAPVAARPGGPPPATRPPAPVLAPTASAPSPAPRAVPPATPERSLAGKVAQPVPAPARDPFASAPPRTAELFPEAPAAPRVAVEPEPRAAAPLVTSPAPSLPPPSAAGAPESPAAGSPPAPRPAPLEDSREVPIVTGRMIRAMELPLAPLGALEMSSDMDFIASDSGSTSWTQRALEVDFSSLETPDAQGVPLARVHEFLPVWEPHLEQDGDADAGAFSTGACCSRGMPWVQLPEVMEALRRATTRGQLGQALLSYARGRFPRGFLLGETFGSIRVGLACGSGSDRPEVAALKVDLTTPSLLAQAASDGGPVVSSAPESHTDQALFTALGESFSHLVAAPIRVRQRAVGFVVIDGGPSPFGADELDELERLLAAASEAYGRLHESSF